MRLCPVLRGVSELQDEATARAIRQGNNVLAGIRQVSNEEAFESVSVRDPVETKDV